MSLVNELFQNIRFLKFYGWGMYTYGYAYLLVLMHCSETGWSSRARDARETELRWRVKENIVSTVISFIWWVKAFLVFMTAKLWGSQDLDAIRHGALDIPLLHAPCRPKADRFEGLYFHCTLQPAARAHDRASRPGIRPSTWSAIRCLHHLCDDAKSPL